MSSEVLPKLNKDQALAMSVVMTAYNSAKYIRQAIQSVLSQTFKDFEFVIVDDASTDKTVEIIQFFKDPRIVFIQNLRNLGQTKSLNVALRHSRGKYIARMDADDICAPKRLEIQYNFLESSPNVAVVGSWTMYIDHNDRPFRLFKSPNHPLEIKCFLAGSGDLSYWCFSHPTVVFRREVFEEIGLYNEEKGEIQGYPQDYDLWARMLPRYDFANIPEVLLYYRVLGSSDSHKFALKQLDYRWEITLRKIKYFLPEISENDLDCLAKMLEFRPQDSSEDGQRVLKIFDTYVQKVTEAKEPEIVNRVRERMKMYYLPQLFVTNKSLSFHELFRQVSQHPLFLFDAKLYRKIGKSFLHNRQLKAHYA